MRARLLAVITVVMLLVSGCSSSDSSSPAAPRAGASAAPSGQAIPQPALPGSVPVAPDSERVDLRMPTFSDPTTVTNPLFPVSRQDSVLFVGRVDGKPFRTEVTLLPYTRVIDWSGVRVETLVSQYTAYLDGRLQEVAYDLYAQADDGSVWYFGEDVADLANGHILTKEGTWEAGKDGPAQMIMPGDPRVGDVYRTENIPGIAFEQVTVKSTDSTLDGPFGPLQGGMVGEELHMDGSTEDKLFAPGYGEFYTKSGPDVEALALAVPTDAVTSDTPTELTTLEIGADRVFDAATSRDWQGASGELGALTTAWSHYRAGQVPRLVEPVLSGAIASLTRAVRAQEVARSRQAAIDVARWSLDLQLRYRPSSEIDLARFGLWAQQLQVDATARDANSVNGDVFTLFYLRDRILHTLAPADVPVVNGLIGTLQIAGADQNLAAAAKAAGRARDLVARIEATSG
jgi:hypothetical protein